MSNVIIAHRYAQALKEEADGLGSIELVDEDVALFQDSLASSKELNQFFESPMISREKKASAVRELFGERVQKTTLHFLLLMIEKRREQIFPDVIKAYRIIRDDQLGFVNVSVRVATELGDAEESELIETIEGMIHKKVRLETVIDETLLGGLVVRVGDMVYDGSFVNQLQTLRDRLETGHYSLN